MTRHGRLGLAALALLASLTFVPSAFAGSTNQIVQKSGTTVTWTGGSQNNGANPDDDAITVTEAPGEVTIVSTSGPITLFPDGPTGDTTTGCAQPNANSAVCGTDVAAFTANARDGNDTVDASGLTSIPAILNADEVDGDAGVDTMSGGDANDTLSGLAGNDTLDGNGGNDYIDAGINDDTVNGGSGQDRLYGGDGADTLNGGDDTDYVDGGNDNDVVNGDAGDDAYHSCCFAVDGGLEGGAGDDVINGGDGIDYADGGSGEDVINGDAGDDKRIDTCIAAASIGGQSCIIVYGGLYGGDDNDEINGGDGDDSAYGQEGDDVIDGGAGDDGIRSSCFGCNEAVLDGGTGTDAISGGEGNDYIRGSAGDDTLNGNAGDDYITGDCDGTCNTCDGDCGPQDPGGDTINGGDGTDTLRGEDGADTVNGDAGDDRVFEYDDQAADTVHGGTGIDDLTYSSCCNPVSITLDDVANDGETAPADTKDPGDAGNNYASDLNNVHYIGTSCNNCASGFNPIPATIVGNSGANLLFGSSGDDDITGGDGADYLNGGSGADTFHARDGYPDYIDCEDGVDTAIVDQFDRVHHCENVDPADVASAFDTAKPPLPPLPAGPASVPDITPPVLNIVVPKTTFTAEQLVLGVKVSFSCNEDCSLNLRLLAQQSSGSATFARVKGYNVVVGRRTLGFGTSKRNVKVRPCERKPGGPQSKACLKRFKKSLNARLAKTGKVTMKLIAVTEDRAGNRTQRTKTITIRGKKK